MGKMLRRELENGVNIEERRVEGVTVRQQLEAQFPTRSIGIGPLRYYFSKTPDIPTPDLKFNNVFLYRVDAPAKHLLALGDDENRRFLVRDDQVLIEGNNLTVYDMTHSDNYDNLAVVSYDLEGNSALHLIDGKGQASTVLEGTKNIHILKSTEPRDLFLVSSETEEGKSLDRVDINGEVKNIVSQAVNIALPSQKEWSVDGNGNYWPGIAPVAYTKIEGEEYEYVVGLVNTQSYWLVKHSTRKNIDLHSIDVRLMDRGALQQKRPLLWSAKLRHSSYIFRGEELIFENESQISLTTSGPDTLFAAYGFNKASSKPHLLFYTTPKGNDAIEGLDDIKSIEAEEHFIKTEYIRNGVLRTALITNTDNSSSPQLNEQAA